MITTFRSPHVPPGVFGDLAEGLRERYDIAADIDRRGALAILIERVTLAAQEEKS